MEFLSLHSQELLLRINEHILLTGVSTFIAILLGIPLGIIAFQKPLTKAPILSLVNILQTVPSLAMLVILLSLYQRIGMLPAMTALTLYALLPIVRNTLTGLEGVSKSVIEAAKGIGMTSGQELIKVRLPLAASVIISGVRTAAVISVGIATLSAFIGAGGLGQFINRGLTVSDTKLILLGAIPAALLAIIIDWAINVFESSINYQKKSTKINKAAGVIAIAILLASCCFSISFNQTNTERISIGSKNFTEQLILAELMAQLIEAKTDINVDRKFNLGGTIVCHKSLLNGEIDLYPEYTGTSLLEILEHPLISDSQQAFMKVKAEYKNRFDLIWLEPFDFNNTYALAVRPEDATKYNWDKISDLKPVASKLKAGLTPDFVVRSDGYPRINSEYGIQFGKVYDLETRIMYEALDNNEVDVLSTYATDGKIKKFNLVLLKDDLGIFPEYKPAPIMKSSLLKRYPRLEQVLNILSTILDEKSIQELNYQVDQEKQNFKQVAQNFLQKQSVL